MNQLDLDYQNLLRDILDNGVEKNTRNGQTISVFGRSIRYKFKDGKFPLLTTKKMYFKGIVTELLWFLRGDTNIKYLIDNDCHIWDGDAYQGFSKYVNEQWHSGNLKEMVGNGYIIETIKTNEDYDSVGYSPLSKKEFIEKIKTDDEFAEKWGSLGKIYGKQWRGWRTIDDSEMRIHTYETDQISNLIEQLKTNPDSRRLMVNAWNVGELDQMTLPPCHYGFQVYTRELSFHERWSLYSDKPYDGNGLGMINTLDFLDDNEIPKRAISLMWNQRSVDTPLGLPFNIASYALLLEIIGKMVNMVPDELIGNLGDAHIYKNQIDGVNEQLTRESYPLPKLEISNNINFDGTIDDFVNSCLKSDFQIREYETHPTIKIPLSN
jgi:thymidylate synthase